MKISEKIQAKADEIAQEQQQHPGGPTPIADQVQRLAEKAMFGGGQNPDWRTYMSQFADIEADLNKLIPTNDPPEDPKQLARAYLVRNGVCGMGSTRNMLDNVTTTLD